MRGNKAVLFWITLWIMILGVSVVPASAHLPPPPTGGARAREVGDHSVESTLHPCLATTDDAPSTDTQSDSFGDAPLSIVIDDGCPGADPPGFERRAPPAEDAWICISAQNQVYWANGGDALYVRTNANPVEWVRWRPTINTAGTYRVEVSIPNYSSNASKTQQARYKVHHADGDTWFTINQEAHAGSWYTLGEFRFNVGTGGYVYLESYTTENPWRLLAADAARFTLISTPTPKLTHSRLYIDEHNHLALEFCGTDIHQEVYIGSKRAGQDFGIRSLRVDFGSTERCTVSDDLANGPVLPGKTYYTGVALERSDVYVVCHSDQGLCDEITTPPTPDEGFLYFPIGRPPSQVPVSAWFDLYYDQQDYAAGIISEYNGIEGYNSRSTKYTGPGYCSSRDNYHYFYPGYVRDYKHPTAWYYSCNWSFGHAYNRHGGTDYAVSGANIPIKAAAPGRVTWTSDSVVIIRHDNNAQTFYAHIRRVGRFDNDCRWLGPLNVGDHVGRGQIIGCGTDANNHLHFGVKLNAGSVPWHDGNPANHAPIVDPYTNGLWAGSSPHTLGSDGMLIPDDAFDDNETPIARFSSHQTYAQVGELVTFDGAASYDEDGDVERFEWDFGDGITATGQVVEHAYDAPGTYYVELAVEDDVENIGYSERIPIVVFDSTPPEVEVEKTFHAWQSLEGTTYITVELAESPQTRIEATWVSGDVDLSLVDPQGRVITSGTTISGVMAVRGVNRLAFVITNGLGGDYLVGLIPLSDVAYGVQLRSYVADVTPPTAKVEVDVSEAISQVVFTLSITDTSRLTDVEMRYAINGEEFGEWQPFERTVELPWSVDQGPDGVVFQFRDGNGNISSLYDGSTFFTWLDGDRPVVVTYLPLVSRNE